MKKLVIFFIVCILIGVGIYLLTKPVSGLPKPMLLPKTQPTTTPLATPTLEINSQTDLLEAVEQTTPQSFEEDFKALENLY